MQWLFLILLSTVAWNSLNGWQEIKRVSWRGEEECRRLRGKVLWKDKNSNLWPTTLLSILPQEPSQSQKTRFWCGLVWSLESEIKLCLLTLLGAFHNLRESSIRFLIFLHFLLLLSSSVREFFRDGGRRQTSTTFNFCIYLSKAGMHARARM